MNEVTLTLNSPITTEQYDAIMDVDFDHTDRIWFNTKHGKTVEFVKASQWIPCSERVPEKSGMYIITDKHGNVNLVSFHATDIESAKEYWKSQTEAWMPCPKPAKLEND